MKNIQLKKLELTNYRNIEHAVYEFNGNSKIVGDNRIGKTNTLEAICFLLTGTLLNGSNDLPAIKPLNNQRAVVSVAGTFDIDGNTITIEKKYGEEWVKARNTGEEVLKGHFCELWYNGVKQPTVRDYNTLFNADFGINQAETTKVSLVQLLVNPSYIGDLGDSNQWSELRRFIIDLVGDVLDEDVYTQEPTTAILRDEIKLANGRLDQVKLKLANEIKSLKETLIGDDAKIEVHSKVETPDTTMVETAKAKINSINEEIVSLQSQNAQTQTEIDIKNKIADINVKIAEEKAKATPNNDDVITISNKRNALYDSKSEVQRKISHINYQIDNQQAKVNNLSKEKDKLLDEYYDLKNAKIEVETVCPTCKRPLDPSQIEKAKKELADNNSVKMDIVIVEGKKKAMEIEAETKELDNLKAKVPELEKELDYLNDEIIKVCEELESARANQTAPVESEELKKLTAEKDKLTNDLNEIKVSAEKLRMSVSTRIYELEQSKAPYQKVLDDFAYSNRAKEEKARCETEKVAHEKELIRKEQMREMLQKFTFTKLKMLDNNVSSVFGNIKFKLIEEQINGGFAPICKPYIYDPERRTSTNVLWKSGSKSERVATGIAIAEAIKTKLGLSNMPYLFDEGGELSQDTIKTRLQTNSQIICVKVQDNIITPMVLSL